MQELVYRLECRNASSCKFYELYIDDLQTFHVIARYGRIGLPGKSVPKGRYVYRTSAIAKIESIYREKLMKGYTIVPQKVKVEMEKKEVSPLKRSRMSIILDEL